MKKTKCKHCAYALNPENKITCLLCGNVSELSLIAQDFIKLGYSDAIIIEKANPLLIQVMDFILKEERKNIATR